MWCSSKQQHMVALAKHEQLRSQRRLAGQIEALPRCVDDGFVECGLGDIILVQTSRQRVALR